MSETPAYRFKKDDPNYYEQRKKKLNEQTKARYASNPEARARAKNNAKKQYQEMKLALQKVRFSGDKL